MSKFLTKPYLKAYAGLAINLSAALLAAPFVGYTISLPRSLFEFLILILDVIMAIIFLLVTVWCEGRLGRKR